MPKPVERSRLLAALYVLEAVFYLTYSVWRIFVDPFLVYRGPPAIGTLAYGFLFLTFIAGVFFIYRASTLLTGRTCIGITDLYASAASVPLWILPAWVYWIDALYGYYYVTTIALFTMVGAINITSIALVMLNLKRKKANHNEQQ